MEMDEIIKKTEILRLCLDSLGFVNATISAIKNMKEWRKDKLKKILNITSDLELKTSKNLINTSNRKKLLVDVYHFYHTDLW